jgi:hypothetical protein
MHHGRKSSMDEKELEPGNLDETKSFVQLWKREGQVAAYALYNRRDEFRRFAMSPWVLLHYVRAFTDRSKIQVRQENAVGWRPSVLLSQLLSKPIEH